MTTFNSGFPVSEKTGRIVLDSQNTTTNFVNGLPINALTYATPVNTSQQSATTYNDGFGLGAAGNLLIYITTGALPAGAVFHGGFAYTATGQLIVDSSSPIANYVGGVPVTTAGAVCTESTSWFVDATGTISDPATLTRMGGGVSNGSNSLIMCGVTDQNVLNFYIQNQQNKNISFPQLTAGPTILPGTLATVSQTGYGVMCVYAKADGLYANNLRLVGGALTQSEQKISSDVPVAGSQISLTGQTQTNYWYGFVSATLTGATGVTTLIPFWTNLGSVQVGGAAITTPNSGAYNLASCPINGEGNMMFVGSNDTAIYRLTYNTTNKTVAIAESYLNGTLFVSNFQPLQLTNVGGSNNYVAVLMSDSKNSNNYELGVLYFDTTASKAPFLKISQGFGYVGNGGALVAAVIGNRVNNNVAVLLAYKNTNGTIVGYQFTGGALTQVVTSQFANSPVATGYAFWSDSSNNSGAAYNGDLIVEYQFAAGGLPGTYALSEGLQLL
jgi:hypothetical protein